MSFSVSHASFLVPFFGGPGFLEIHRQNGRTLRTDFPAFQAGALTCEAASEVARMAAVPKALNEFLASKASPEQQQKRTNSQILMFEHA